MKFILMVLMLTMSTSVYAKSYACTKSTGFSVPMHERYMLPELVFIHEGDTAYKISSGIGSRVIPMVGDEKLTFIETSLYGNNTTTIFKPHTYGTESDAVHNNTVAHAGKVTATQTFGKCTMYP